MLLEDRFYGDRQINERVIIDLVNSDEVQRLKDVSQLGVPDEFYHRKGYSRYEHSIGVFLLLRRCRASLDEQIAGLLHDVSHAAFSHVYDWVLGSTTKEDYQDNAHKEIISCSQIPKILRGTGIDPEKISHLEKFKLLDMEIPEICADRFDYFIRDPGTKIDDARYLLTNLIVYDGKLIFADRDSASCFGYSFLKAQVNHWGHEETSIRYHLFAEVLKIALNEGIIASRDFSGTEKPIIEKLKQSKHPEIQKRLRALSGKLNYHVNEQNPSLFLKKKFRYVDPLYIQPGGPARLSESDSRFRELVERERRLNNLGTCVDIYL